MAVDEVTLSMETPFGNFKLQRYPAVKKETLRAWDAADEYLLHHLAENALPATDASLLIVNDAFGGLAVPLNNCHPVVMIDSYLSNQAIVNNAVLNGIDQSSITIINSLEPPQDHLDHAADIILIKLPKSLAMLEDQLHRLRPAVNSSTRIIAAGMTRHIHMSTMAMFEKILGPTTTSLAKKKARLIFCRYDEALTVPENPYPDSFRLDYQLDGADMSLLNHASVFSRESLDIGSRLFLQHMPVAERYRTIVDLGCGNGVLGLIAAIKNPQAKLIFTDQSYMAVESAIQNFVAVFGETRDAEFLQTDCLQGIEPGTISLILCNPPFHQDNVVNDDVAWQMFNEAKAALHDAGELWVIGNRHLAYHAKLKYLFGSCDVMASNRKFTLLKAVKR